MYKKTVTYTDYDGVERTESFFFNLSRAELLDMELGSDGGMTGLINKIVDEKDTKRIVGLFKDIMNRSYGVKSDDGKRFIKNEEVLNEFLDSAAYSDIYMELVTNTDKAIEFVNGIMPADLVEKAAKQELEANIVPVSIE